jgi:hypothetical protein
VDPFLKVCRPGEGAFSDLNQSLEAFIEIVFWKMVDIVLKWVRNKPVANPDPGLTFMMKPTILPQEGDHGLVEVLIVGELDVTADVPGKAFIIDER